MNPHAEKSSDVTSSGPWSGCNQSGIVRDKRGVVVASCVKADWAGEVAKLPELLAADGVCGFDSSALDLPAHLPEKPQIELNAQKGIAKAFSWSCLCMPLACLSIGAGMAVLVVFCGIWFGWW